MQMGCRREARASPAMPWACGFAEALFELAPYKVMSCPRDPGARIDALIWSSSDLAMKRK
jgi:hypothetical protein